MLIETLQQGGVAVIPTDTIYGIVGRAHNSQTVKEVRRLKSRGPDQAFIILCANIKQVRSFDIHDKVLEKAQAYWPGPVSVVMDTQTDWPDISGNLEGIAFRIPDHPELLELLTHTGPLVAPSANPHGKEPAASAEHAQDYFGEGVSVYVDYGEVVNIKPSKLIRLKPDLEEIVIRP